MNKYGIKNYEEFKELFIREDGKRKNRVILDMWKDKDFMKFISTKTYGNALRECRSMADLYYLCDAIVCNSGVGNHSVDLIGKLYRNNIYATDAKGICVDGDFRSYRYANMERGGQVFKMKIGKMYKHLILSSEFGKHLPMSVVLYMCEEMANRWVAYSASRVPKYELHVDDEFWRIYDGDECDGDFCSCMTNGDNYHFYEDAVKAKAAYLLNPDGLIIARCVIFTDVKTKDGKTLRLAERQYSTEGDDILKKMLVYALIKEGHIDGYKKIGAGCHSPELWMDTMDNPMPDAHFSIKCDLSAGDTISYQDSFKWYDPYEKIAYNYPASNTSEVLSTTDDTYDGAFYDSFHEEHTDADIVDVYYHGERYTCAENWLDDFVWIDALDEYHHIDDCDHCDWCDEYFISRGGSDWYSELTSRSYCCENCMCEDERAYKEENWTYSDFDDEYYEDDDEVVDYNYWNGKRYITQTIHTASLSKELERGHIIEIDGNYYDNPEKAQEMFK